MNTKLLTVLLGTAAMLNLSAGTAERKEILPLDSFAVPQRWNPAESSVTVAPEKINGRPALKWTAPIDHFAGEKKYPVGWPRMYFKSFYKKPTVITDWKNWDYFEFEIKMTLENDPENKSCPVTVAVLSAAERPNFSLPLKKLHDGKFHKISIPIDRIVNPAKITYWGFSIAESNYKHGGKLTVVAGNFRLVRSSECTVAVMKLLSPAITSADRAVKLNIQITGPAGDVARGVPFEISCAKTGKVIRRETLPVLRGIRDIEVEIDELSLAPGKYFLKAFPGSKVKEKSVVFQVVSSPYKVKK